MKTTLKIPKQKYEVGDKFHSEYGNDTYIITDGKLESLDIYKYGQLIAIEFDYYYGIETHFLNGHKIISRISESELEATCHLTRKRNLP